MQVGDKVAAVQDLYRGEHVIRRASQGKVIHVGPDGVTVQWDGVLGEGFCFNNAVVLLNDEEETEVTGEAVKYDGDKPRMDLLDSNFLFDLAQVMTYGADKYKEHNWRKGMAHSRYYAAMMRHAWAYWGGEEDDPESGLPHLAHAAACLLMLMGIKRTHPELDDRGEK